MQSTELERRAAIRVGDLVYYDTIQSGRVPCKVVDTAPGRYSTDAGLLTLKVTSARYAYPKGLIFTARRGPFVHQRAAIS